MEYSKVKPILNTNIDHSIIVEYKYKTKLTLQQINEIINKDQKLLDEYNKKLRDIRIKHHKIEDERRKIEDEKRQIMYQVSIAQTNLCDLKGNRVYVENSMKYVSKYLNELQKYIIKDITDIIMKYAISDHEWSLMYMCNIIGTKESFCGRECEKCGTLQRYGKIYKGLYSNLESVIPVCI
jgi:hypothetical protein